VRWCIVRTSPLIIALLLAAPTSGQWSLGPQLGASPTFRPFTPHPALGIRVQRILDHRWQLFAESLALPPEHSSFSGIVDPRRQLASVSPLDTTVRHQTSEWHALPLALSLGATSRIGPSRRSSVRAHRYWCLAFTVHHIRQRQAWSSTGVYSGVEAEGHERWSSTSIAFAPGIGHRSRVHGRKRYFAELRPGLQRAIGVGRHAAVSGSLGIALGVNWGL